MEEVACESDCGVTAGDNCSPSLSTAAAASLCTWPILFLPLSHKIKNMKSSYSGRQAASP